MTHNTVYNQLNLMKLSGFGDWEIAITRDGNELPTFCEYGQYCTVNEWLKAFEHGRVFWLSFNYDDEINDYTDDDIERFSRGLSVCPCELMTEDGDYEEVAYHWLAVVDDSMVTWPYYFDA